MATALAGSHSGKQHKQARRMRRVVSLNTTTTTSSATTDTTATSSAAALSSAASASPSRDGTSEKKLVTQDALSRARVVERHLRTATRADQRRNVLHGLVRVPWICGLRTCRLLALKERTLVCCDQHAERVLWREQVEGARVRVQVAQRKVVVSKLVSGAMVQFWAPDELATRRWAAALLRASSLARLRERHWL